MESEPGTQLDDVPDAILLVALGFLAQPADIQHLLRASNVSKRFHVLTSEVLATQLTAIQPSGQATAQAMVWMGTNPHLHKLVTLTVEGAAACTGFAFLTSCTLGR